MTKKITLAQAGVIEILKRGNFIEYFRGIGTRYRPGACIVDKDGTKIDSISVSTVRSMRDRAIIREVHRDNTHTKYTLNQF